MQHHICFSEIIIFLKNWNAILHDIKIHKYIICVIVLNCVCARIHCINLSTNIQLLVLDVLKHTIKKIDIPVSYIIIEMQLVC